MAYKCPLNTCDEEFDERVTLLLHLDTVHPMYSGACANQIQPTPSTRVIKCPTVSHNVSFYFYAPPNLRFSRRMETGRPGRLRGRRPFRPIVFEMAVLKALLVSRLTAHPRILSWLITTVYGERPRPSQQAAAERLLSFVSKLRSLGKTEAVSRFVSVLPICIALYFLTALSLTSRPTFSSFFLSISLSVTEVSTRLTIWLCRNCCLECSMRKIHFFLVVTFDLNM